MASAGPLQAVLKTSDGYFIDLDTGLEWRWVQGDELNRTPWPDDKINTFREYGNLSDFESQDNVTIAIAANGSTFEVPFQFEYETNRSVWQLGLRPNSTNGTVEPTVNKSGTVQVRIYTGDAPSGEHNWFAGRVYGDDFGGFYAVGEGPDGNYVKVVQNQTNFLLASNVSDTDLVSVVNTTCMESSSDGGGPQLNSVTNGTFPAPRIWNSSLAGQAACNNVTQDCSATLQPTDVFSVFYIGEIAYCEKTGEANWIIGHEKALVNTVFAFGETDHLPVSGGHVCWFKDDPQDGIWDAKGSGSGVGGFHHPMDYCHNHGGICEHNPLGFHPYPYNAVDKEGSGGHHDFDDYLQEMPEDHDHLEDHTTSALPPVDKYQVLHRFPELTSNGDRHGAAIHNGKVSIATQRDPGGFAPTHEIGHLWGATHEASRCTADDEQITVMGTDFWAGEKGCDYERTKRFSESNIDNVNS